MKDAGVVDGECDDESDADDGASDDGRVENVENVDDSCPGEYADESGQEGSDLELSVKRHRRKPVWAKDYVFHFRVMPKTKTTPRKMMPTVCPVCKHIVKEGENFREHLVACSESRIACEICGNSFKKRAYLTKHMETKHKSVDQPQCSTSNIQSDQSDWEEPDVSLGEESDDESLDVHNMECTGDGTNSQNVVDQGSREESTVATRPESSLEVGRIVRKATMPDPPPTTKRKSSVGCDTESAKKKKCGDGRSDKKTKIENEYVVCCARKGEEFLTEVTKDGEVVYKSSVMDKRARAKNGPVHIGDMVPEGVINSNDMDLYIEGQCNVKLRLRCSSEQE